MEQLLSQLGIDWPLLLSQAVNFALLLIVLRIFVYKPLMHMLRERRNRIEEGLTKAEEADTRLREATETSHEKVREAEREAMGILKRVEGEAKDYEVKLLAAAKAKEDAALASAQARLATEEERSHRELEKEAARLVREAIVKTVELAPEQIDDALIAQAVREVSNPPRR